MNNILRDALCGLGSVKCPVGLLDGSFAGEYWTECKKFPGRSV